MNQKMTAYLTEEETATMWLLGNEYSSQRLGIRDFWKQLPENRKELVRDFLSELARARGGVVNITGRAVEETTFVNGDGGGFQ